MHVHRSRPEGISSIFGPIGRIDDASELPGSRISCPVSVGLDDLGRSVPVEVGFSLVLILQVSGDLVVALVGNVELGEPVRLLLVLVEVRVCSV